jgi:hypothetical protein
MAGLGKDSEAAEGLDRAIDMHDGKARCVCNVYLRERQPRSMDPDGFPARQLLAKQVRHTFKGCPAARAAQSLPVDRSFEHRGPPEGESQRRTRQKPFHIPVGDDCNRAVGRRLYADLMINTQADQITYYYTSRLAGEPAAGVNDVHFHPVEPLAVRFTLAKAF